MKKPLICQDCGCTDGISIQYDKPIHSGSIDEETENYLIERRVEKNETWNKSN